MPFDDIIGAEDIIGAGAELALGAGYNELDSLFGASRQLVIGADGGASPQANANQVATMLAARGSAMVVPRQVTKAREYPIGFPTTSVTAGAAQTITTQPQVPFRARRLIVPSDIAGSFLINDLKVGKNSMFATSNPVPARAFTEVGVGVDLNLDTAQISQLIAINVTNSSGADLDFNACLIGTAVE